MAQKGCDVGSHRHHVRKICALVAKKDCRSRIIYFAEIRAFRGVAGVAKMYFPLHTRFRDLNPSLLPIIARISRRLKKKKIRSYPLNCVTARHCCGCFVSGTFSFFR
jgi:hypothetical protein